MGALRRRSAMKTKSTVGIVSLTPILGLVLAGVLVSTIVGAGDPGWTVNRTCGDTGVDCGGMPVCATYGQSCDHCTEYYLNHEDCSEVDFRKRCKVLEGTSGACGKVALYQCVWQDPEETILGCTHFIGQTSTPCERDTCTTEPKPE